MSLPCALPTALPEGHSRLLLHTCCAPCSGEVMERLCASGIDYTLYFYNPNIHPQKEYLLRKEENLRFAQKLKVPFVDGDYDPAKWFAEARGMENEPERGVRCSMCFTSRFVATAVYARTHGFSLISSSLGISRWKDVDQINRAGLQAAAATPGIDYWTLNWRKGGGAERMIAISRREHFYQQEYCGCAYSLRDSNRARRARGRPAIVLGTQYYGQS